MGLAPLDALALGPANSAGLLRARVPGAPDCRAAPVGDGTIGAEGCPFQLFAAHGSLAIAAAGLYVLCLSSTDGCLAPSRL